jgi:two-component system response regulator YesN
MAVDMVRRNQPHVVVMDVLMPVMRGDEAMKIIQAEYPDIAIVMYSADVTLEKPLKEAGATEFIALPTSPTALTTTIRHAWRNKHPN